MANALLTIADEDCIRGLYSAPLNIKNPSPASHMHIHDWHLVCICIITRRAINIGLPNSHSNRKSAILIQSSPFTPILINFHASYFNELLLQIEHHRLPIHSVSSSDLEHQKYQKLSPMSNMVVSWCDPFSCFAIKHEVLLTSTYNFPCTPNSSYIYMMSPCIPLCINTVSYW